jgi:CBS-domain-containing membrane protein
LLLSIDFNAAAVLIGLGSTGRIYSIDPATGAATLASLITGAALQGTRFDMDFKPADGNSL